MSREVSGKHIYINEYTGKTVSAFGKRNELAHDHLGSASYVGEEVILICPLCFGQMTHNGSNIDHIVSITQLQTDLLMDEEQAKKKVGHPSNLLQAHTNCNSSKSKKDIFEWWRSENSKSFISPTNRERVLAVVDKIYTRHAKSALTHFTFGDYKTVMLQIKAKVISGG